MKRSLLALLNASALSLALLASPMQASAGDFQNYARDWRSHYYHEILGLPKGFNSDMLAKAVGEEAAANVRQSRDLQPGWTEEQYCKASANQKVLSLRKRYNLPPYFSESDFQKGVGTARLNERIEYLKLPPHFTEAQYREAEGLEKLKGRQSQYPDLPNPFSAADYVRVSGTAAIADLAKKFNFRDDFVYADLVAAAGPHEAASQRRMAKFEINNASHAEMITQAGTLLGYLVKDYNLPVAFTASQLVDGPAPRQ